MSPAHSIRALLLFAHGSSDPAWALPFARIQQAVARQQPGIPVALAFLERSQPAFADAVLQLVAAGVTEVSVVPLFLAAGGHIKADLPRLVAEAEAAHGLRFSILPTLGESPAMIEAIAQWILTATQSPTV